MARSKQVKPLKSEQTLRRSVERRLKFIEFCLFWEGRINRSDIMDKFGISEPQASGDLSRYQEMAPDNIEYDKSIKCYLATPKFKAVTVKPDADRYLMQLRSISDSVVTAGESWIVRGTEYDVVPTPKRTINANRLRAILKAIREQATISIHYQSLSRPDPMWRWISPHALGFDGFRWHARAYCHIDNIFKDFLLPRIQGVRGSKESEIQSKSDEAWHSKITLRVGPHPDLSENQKKVVELDYGMKEASLGITTRKAFLYYVLKRLGLDLPEGTRSAKDQHIVLLNRNEIDDALAVSQQRRAG